MPTSRTPSGDRASVTVISAGVLDRWLDAATGEAVVVFEWGETRVRPSPLGYERLRRVEGWPVRNDRRRTP